MSLELVVSPRPWHCLRLILLPRTCSLSLIHSVLLRFSRSPERKLGGFISREADRRGGVKVWFTVFVKDFLVVQWYITLRDFSSRVCLSPPLPLILRNVAPRYDSPAIPILPSSIFLLRFFQQNKDLQGLLEEIPASFIFFRRFLKKIRVYKDYWRMEGSFIIFHYF